MAFDLSTAKPESQSKGFDLSTAKPVSATAAPEQQPDQSSFGGDAMAVIAELAAGANRSVTEFVDFVGPDTINSILRLSGREGNFPTLTGALEPYGIQGNFMEQGTSRDAVRGLGSAIPAAAGMVQVPRNLAKAGGALAEFAGFGSAKSAAPAAANVANSVVDQKLSLLRQSGDTSTAGLMVDDAGNLVKDKVAKTATKQGFDPGLVAMVKSANADTRKKMSAMLDIVEKGKANFRYSGDHRPLNVVGDSVLNRIKVVREANRVAGSRLDGVAKSLKGQGVDPSPAVNSFLEKLDDMGVAFNPADRSLSFQGSDLGS